MAAVESRDSKCIPKSRYEYQRAEAEENPTVRRGQDEAAHNQQQPQNNQHREGAEQPGITDDGEEEDVPAESTIIGADPVLNLLDEPLLIRRSPMRCMKTRVQPHRQLRFRFASPFFTVDVALRRDGVLRIVEFGDGQVSDRKHWSCQSLIRMLAFAV